MNFCVPENGRSLVSKTRWYLELHSVLQPRFETLSGSKDSMHCNEGKNIITYVFVKCKYLSSWLERYLISTCRLHPVSMPFFLLLVPSFVQIKILGSCIWLPRSELPSSVQEKNLACLALLQNLYLIPLIIQITQL